MSKFEPPLTEKELAKYFRVKLCTVRRWRHDGTGPHYVKGVGKPLYKRQDIIDFENRRTFKSSSERVEPKPTGGDDVKR